MQDFDDDMHTVEQTEAVAVCLAILAILARPVRHADISTAAALELLADAPALIEDALGQGEISRVAYTNGLSL